MMSFPCDSLAHITDTQLDISILWHQLIDHNHNKEKIPFNT